MKKIIVLALLVSMSFGAGYLLAGPKHPNLRAALHSLQEAKKSILAAQKANEYDMGGHAKNAQNLIDQAEGELKQAADAADAH